MTNNRTAKNRINREEILNTQLFEVFFKNETHLKVGCAVRMFQDNRPLRKPKTRVKPEHLRHRTTRSNDSF